MEEWIRRSISELRSEVDSLRESQHRIEGRVTSLSELCTELEHEIGGAPRVGIRGERKNMRQRIHDLENDRAAAIAATAALETARAVRSETWTRAQKIGLFAFAAGGFVIALLSLLLTHH